MSKRDDILRGGLSTLLGENKQEQEEQKASEQAEEQQAAANELEQEEEATPEEEEDLINSINDKELREALHKKRMERRGRPRKDAPLQMKQDELYKRTTLIMRRDYLAKLKEISFRETLTIKDIMDEIIGEAISAYEKKNGELHPRDHRGDPSTLFK